MKKFVTLLVLSVSMFVLTACSSNNDNGNKNETENVSNGNSKVQSTTFADYFNSKKKETNLFYVTNVDRRDIFGKDSPIYSVLVSENGYVTSYDLFDRLSREELTMGDVAKMSDADILEKVKSMWKEKQDHEINSFSSRLDTVKENIDDSASSDFDQNVRTAEKKYLDYLEKDNNVKSVKPYKSKISFNVITDASGNQTQNEELSFNYTDAIYPDLSYTGVINEDGDNYTQFDSQSVDAIDEAIREKRYKMNVEKHTKALNIDGPTLERWSEIYDSNYNIFTVNNADRIIAFRTKKQVLLDFDKPDTKIKNVTVDND